MKPYQKKKVNESIKLLTSINQATKGNSPIFNLNETKIAISINSCRFIKFIIKEKKKIIEPKVWITMYKNLLLIILLELLVKLEFL